MAGPYPNDQGNPAGAIPVYMATGPATKSAHINTSTTTLVKTGPGILNSVTVNTPGSGWTATIYDSLTGSGTVLAVISSPSQGQILYGIPFSTGLTVVTASGTPGDLTISYQ